MIINESINSVILASLLLIREHEIQHQQAITIVAAKVVRSKFLKVKYLQAVEEWLPRKDQYLSYEEIGSEVLCNN